MIELRAKRVSTLMRMGTLAATAALAGCWGNPAADDLGAVDESDFPIFNGTAVSNADNPGAVAVYHNFVRPCSGALFRRQWVVTAHHCLTSDGSPTGPAIPLSQIFVSRTVAPGLSVPAGASQAVKVFLRPGSDRDLAIIKISPEISGTLLGFWNGDLGQLPGNVVRAYGYGRSVDGGNTETENGTTGAGTLRMADLLVDTIFTGNIKFRIVKNSSSQIVWHGDSGGPSVRMTDTMGRALPGIAGVHETGATDHTSGTEGAVSVERAWIKRHAYSPGDANGDGRADIMLTGGIGWTTIPLARSQNGGGFTVTNATVATFPGLTRTINVKLVPGDFNGDGRADIALTGPTDWDTVPIAMSNGNGTFAFTNAQVSQFPALAATAGVKAVPGDFNGDGRGDIALTGASTWSKIPVAFSSGTSGTFTVTNASVADFPSFTTAVGVKVVGGDFDGDGRDDIAATGVAGWTTLPVAFSNGNGFFQVTNNNLDTFPSLAATRGAQAVVGDFNGDGRDDIALTGVAGWASVPIAFALGGGLFTMTNNSITDFGDWAATPGAKAVTGDFNGDTLDDIALTGPVGWGTIPVALSNGDGSFTVTNVAVTDFPTFASQAGARPVSGH